MAALRFAFVVVSWLLLISIAASFSPWRENYTLKYNDQLFIDELSAGNTLGSVTVFSKEAVTGATYEGSPIKVTVLPIK